MLRYFTCHDYRRVPEYSEGFPVPEMVFSAFDIFFLTAFVVGLAPAGLMA